MEKKNHKKVERVFIISINISLYFTSEKTVAHPDNVTGPKSSNDWVSIALNPNFLILS